MPNQPPTIDPIPNQTIPHSQLWGLPVGVNDPDGDPLTYSIDVGPPGADFDADFFSWTPPNTAAGSTVTVRLRVTDDSGDSGTATFLITVTNSPPVFDPIGTQTIAHTEPLLVHFHVDDPEPNDPVTVSILQDLPRGATLNIDSLEWTPEPSDANKTYTVKLLATDSAGATAVVSFLVAVTNSPPAFGPISPQNVLWNSQLVVPFQVSDPDPDDTVTVTIQQDLPRGATLVGNTLQWMPAASDANKTYTVTLLATDTANATATVSFVVTVTDTAPTITPIGNKTVKFYQTLAFPVLANDPDPGDNLQFEITNGPATAGIDNDGNFTWSPTESDANQSITTTVKVTDGAGATASSSFVITVTDASPSLNAIPNQNAIVDQPLLVPVQANDADVPPDDLTFEILSGPGGDAMLTKTSDTTAEFTWTPTATGTYTVNIRVSDLAGASASRQFFITVAAAEASKY